MTRIEFEGALHHVSGERPLVGGPGRLFEIHQDRLLPIELPFPDGVPLAMDGKGRLILGRPSGDRTVRRYHQGKLDATFGFRLEEVLSLAVSGNDLVVGFHSGLVQRIDHRTVPRIDYSRRLGLKANQLDVREDRISMAGPETVLFTHAGGILEKGPPSKRVRLRKNGYWIVGEGLQSGDRSLDPADLELNQVLDVVCGGETEWVLGEALVQLDPS